MKNENNAINYRLHKALPKAKKLNNSSWNASGGAGNDQGTVHTAACHTMGCSGHCQTKQAC